MFEALVAGLVGIFAWPALGFMLLGMSIGFVVGILPGLGGSATLALMLPFVFAMDSIPAMAFLLGMHSVVSTTGDITSILFGVPGEGTTAATIVDGHPMAKKGQAGRALGAALMSSLVGAIIGAFALALAIPIVRPLVLAFFSPEFFMICLLGISFIAVLSGASLVKGLIAGGLGLWLATIGMNPQTGTIRYDLGQLYLWEGISLVPVTVGLFALPELVDMAVKGTSIAEARVGRLGGVMEGVKDTFRHWFLTVRCSLIGTFIGIMPGLGGAVAQWVAYGHAVQSSPNKERFGKGAVEGVLGPGAANNSKEGGALIPTVAFGVPGSVAMAILLGAFLITGLEPGPGMLKEHLDVTFSMVWVIVVANLICVAVSFLFLKQLASITFVKGTLIIAPVLLLVFLGGYAAHNSLGDLVLVLVFGVLGWVMVQLDWPRPPLLIGLVLGGLAETYLYISTARYGYTWLGRPMVIAMMLLLVAVFLVPVVQERQRRRRQREAKA